mmetsp:Transcript_5308/g.19893  ORF Transcript_5308/g.19893 Transcript_5308/m.19893 type:complete len:240 (+) Transcript_5308:609-1328(+)
MAISPPGRNKSRRAKTPKYVVGFTSSGIAGSGSTFSSPSFSICFRRLLSAYRAHSPYAPFVAYRKSPSTFMISWLPCTTNTSPPCFRACKAKFRNLRMMASSLSPRSRISPTCTSTVSPPIQLPSPPITFPSSSAAIVCAKSPCTSPIATRRRPAKSTVVVGDGEVFRDGGGALVLFMCCFVSFFAHATLAARNNGPAAAVLARSARRVNKRVATVAPTVNPTDPAPAAAASTTTNDLL